MHHTNYSKHQGRKIVITQLTREAHKEKKFEDKLINYIIHVYERYNIKNIFKLYKNLRFIEFVIKFEKLWFGRKKKKKELWGEDPSNKLSPSRTRECG